MYLFFYLLLLIVSVMTASLNDQLEISCRYDRLCRLVVRVPGYKTEMYCVYICYVEESRSSLWSSGQSSWLEIQRSGLDFRRYQIF
jgi:hypothetical protein